MMPPSPDSSSRDQKKQKLLELIQDLRKKINNYNYNAIPPVTSIVPQEYVEKYLHDDPETYLEQEKTVQFIENLNQLSLGLLEKLEQFLSENENISEASLDNLLDGGLRSSMFDFNIYPDYESSEDQLQANPTLKSDVMKTALAHLDMGKLMAQLQSANKSAIIDAITHLQKGPNVDDMFTDLALFESSMQESGFKGKTLDALKLIGEYLYALQLISHAATNSTASDLYANIFVIFINAVSTLQLAVEISSE